MITAREFHDFISARRFNEGLQPLFDSEEEKKEPLTFSQQKAAKILQDRLNAKLKDSFKIMGIRDMVRQSISIEDSIES